MRASREGVPELVSELPGLPDFRMLSAALVLRYECNIHLPERKVPGDGVMV